MADSPAWNGTGSDARGNTIACFRCGVCCTRYQVLVSEIEAREIARRLGLTWAEWLQTYVNPAWPGEDTFILRQRDGACSFLEYAGDGKTTRCAIEHFKPLSCREWPVDLQCPECRDGLLQCWGLTTGSSGQIVGAGEKVQSFRSFLQSLPAADGTATPSPGPQ